MTTFLLIRHGETDAIGKTLTGWTAGCHLNKNGTEQATRVAQLLSGLKMQAIYTSPLERAVETADIIAARHELSPLCRDQLGELRFGEWEGQTFDELRDNPVWQDFNTTRSLVGAPGGEFMMEAQTRMVRELQTLSDRHPNDTIGIVSHLDTLRALIAYYLGIPLDFLLRFRLDPASISIVQYFERVPHVVCINRTCELPV